MGIQRKVEESKGADTGDRPRTEEDAAVDLDAQIRERVAQAAELLARQSADPDESARDHK